ncbi:beta-galactosidase [Nonomuraea sp. NPDC050556]|uniref:beta-galactosidase n=1 Tax=Nonomuraea sp. NPDC050556 TaxID=3364369 RepID=UPI003792112E
MTIDVRDGVTVIDGAPRVLVTADYPYYRDDPAVWADRLRAMRDDLGIEVISSYLPWRHHQPVASMDPDFTGQTGAATDVVGFFRLCHSLGLKVIAKPGPFIHAETDFGGLPDWVCPEHNPTIEPLLDAWGQPSRWAGLTLPAPLGTAFAAHAGQWLAAVGKEVLDAATYPEGPVIMMQIANEGIFTNGALPLTAYDYSASGVAFFRDCLREWYGTLDEYNRTHHTTHTTWTAPTPPHPTKPPLETPSPAQEGLTAAHEAPTPTQEALTPAQATLTRAEATSTATKAAPTPETLASAIGSLAALQSYVDWGRFHATYLHEVYRRWSDAVGCRVPVVVNLNPPTVEDLDDWLTRVRPGTWDGIHYGFTNWMGVVSASPDAQARYVIAAKLAPGPNLEENWGFSELYDRAYADATTSYHQTLLALATGATGFNVYTGASTSTWPDTLDSTHSAPYPDCAPIAADGTPTVKAPVVKALADFFAQHGQEFLTATPVTTGAFALYTPYAAIAAQTPTAQTPETSPDAPEEACTPDDARTPEAARTPDGVRTAEDARTSEDARTPECGRLLRAFHDRMRAAGHDYAIVDLETATLDELSQHPVLTVPSGPFMHRHAQDLLAAYVAQGGTLHMDGPPPTLDEHLHPYARFTPTLHVEGASAASSQKHRPAQTDRPSQAALSQADTSPTGATSATRAPAAVRPTQVPSPKTLRVVYGKADAFLRTTGGNRTAYLTVLAAADNDGPVRVETPLGEVEVVTCRGGGAVIRIVDGVADDFIVKGVNIFLDSAVAASITVAGTTTAADHPADLTRLAGKLTTLP